ncbi:metallophosphoesterase [uncultured Draconibacterium sp.]|uniref:metallophosphoesterase n=1 Tax=uncultured Draconibacterium sp. TaxID=1573823 RepID=UPI003260B591
MNIGILHLTDLHIKSSENFLLSRIDKIHDSVRIDILKLERIYFVITGDIVDKGIKSAYSQAKKFLFDLKNKLESINEKLIIKFIIVPGNHDCNFDYDNQLRRNSLNKMGYDTLGEDNSVIDLCLTVQNDFWEFYSEFNDLPLNKLFYQIHETWDNNSICFNCLNTSWMSKKKEEINLFFPVKRFDNHDELEKGKINISLFHHPIFWFTPNGLQNNRKELQSFLEDTSSIILYGHEHEEEHKKSIELWSNRETLYFSGKILQDSLNKESGFQLLLLDASNKKGQIKQFIWKDDIYVSLATKDIHLNGDRFGTKRFKNNIDFLDELNSIRIPISIENNPHLKLSDFYIFPDLERTEQNSSDIDSFYDSEKLISETSFSTCIIEGENQSGKTSLLSMLYRKFVENEKYPLLIDCKSFKTTEVDKVLKSAFFQQYSGEALDFERYLQYEQSKKIILLDNLQGLSFNSKTIKRIIEDLELRFGKVIIITNTLYGLLSKIEAEFEELAVFSLRPLGYRKRNKLIENYHRLSIPVSTITDEILLERTKHSFNQVELVLGNKLMPSYPIFVLSILQTMVYAKPTNYEQTSYGYCYHSLIHIALANKAKVDNEYIDTYFNFLSEFALHLYRTKQGIFTEQVLSNFFTDYQKEYHVAFSFDKLKEALLSSMLILIQDDEWKFSYEYIYYFLIARKLAELIGKEEGQSAIKYLCSNLHEEKNANILIFIAHHTKDDFLIQEATFTAMVPFEDIAPITLERHGHYYDMIKDIVKEISSDIIEASSNPVESRDKILESQDKIEKERSNHKNEINKIEENEGFTEFMTPFFQAYRALDIVGQIIKNRKGSIPANQLVDMIVELYNTAFRTISFFGKTILETKSDFIDSLAGKVEDGDTKLKIEKKVNSFFQYVSLQICLGVFGKVIHSVGQKDLKDLFIEAAKRIDTPAADIVTFSINSYYGKLSTGDVQKIAKKYENNRVAMKIIKARVKAYLYQNFVDYKKRQSFASSLKMQIGPPRR